MSRSQSDKSAWRPTLPPIRDLFQDELTKQRNIRHEPPQAILARLRVSDDNELDQNPPGPQESSPRSRNPSIIRNMEIFRPSNLSQDGYPHRSDDYTTESLYQHPSLAQSSRRIEHDQLPLQRSLSHQFSPPVHDYLRHPVYDNVRVTASPIPVHRDRHRGQNSHDHLFTPQSRGQIVGVPRPSPRPISTRIDHSSEDEDRTPVARYPSEHVSIPHQRQPGSVGEPPSIVSSSSKYECQYCGKGFNRPSSLKIHLNSHTGEKPFVCPVEGCGRSFSVLSNMRRHARVHTQPGKEKEGSSDASDEPSFEQGDEDGYIEGDPKWHQRRASTASSSSSLSRRSRSESPGEEGVHLGRPEKRSRHLT